MVAADFFTIEAWTRRGLQRFVILFFVELSTYVFPLKTLHAVHANDVPIALYLFKAPSAPSTGDITKVFMNSPQQAVDG